MKKAGPILVLLVLLSGCANTSREIQRGMALRSALLKGQGCTFEADVTADYGDKLYSFSMACKGNAQGDLTFTVTAPETISGITGSLTQQGGKLTFDDTALQFDLLADGMVSPVSGPWILLKTLRSGCLTSACTEEGQVRLTIDDSYRDDALHLDIWLDEKDLPVRGDILYKDRRILSLSIKNFALL